MLISLLLSVERLTILNPCRPRFLRCQVIIGPESDDGPWYFSLNNRRLWVFKRLREEGLLPNNQIAVRVRPPKSEAERARYSLENCALEAKLMREGLGVNKTSTTEVPSSMSEGVQHVEEVTKSSVEAKKQAKRDDDVGKTTSGLESLALLVDGDDEDSSDDSSVGLPGRSNPFSALG